MSTISAGTTVGTALVNSGDTTGNLVIKTGANATTALTISGTDQSITVAGGLNLGAPVAVASGGTGANSASAARTNLGTNDAANITTGTLAIANGGTGANTATAAFNALNPMTTTGDIIYEASSTVAARLGIGSTGQVLTVAGGLPSWASLPAGGVTSLNGQTGAITNTDLYAIGSYVTGRPANGTTYSVNNTVAGSSLFAARPTAYWNPESGNWGNGSGQTLVNTGTWRCVSPANLAFSSEAYSGLWVRIS
jgi:trimeric autotransporter adhesin